MELTRTMLQQLAPRLRRQPDRAAFAEWLAECLDKLPEEVYDDAMVEFQTVMNRYLHIARRIRRQQMQQQQSQMPPPSSQQLPPQSSSQQLPPQSSSQQLPPQSSSMAPQAGTSGSSSGMPPPMTTQLSSGSDQQGDQHAWQPMPQYWPPMSARQQQQAQASPMGVWQSQDYQQVQQQFPQMYPPMSQRSSSCPPSVPPYLQPDSSGYPNLGSANVSGRSSGGFTDMLNQMNQSYQGYNDDQQMHTPQLVRQGPASATSVRPPTPSPSSAAVTSTTATTTTTAASGASGATSGATSGQDEMVELARERSNIVSINPVNPANPVPVLPMSSGLSPRRSHQSSQNTSQVNSEDEQGSSSKDQ